MASDEQIEANRENAQHSTGAKTPEGKANVSKNALKHGLLSQAVVIETEEIKESKSEYEELQKRFIEDLQPVGVLEETLVDRIVSTYWRLRRVIKAEKGEIRKGTDVIFFKTSMTTARVAKKYIEMPIVADFKDKILNSVFTVHAKEKLQEYKSMIERDGYLLDVPFNEYLELKGLNRNEQMLSLFFYFNRIGKGEIPEEDKEKGKNGLLYFINNDLETVEKLEEAGKEIERLDLETDTLSKNIPSQEVADKITRYETALENQLYKAINQLIKLQALRKGGRVISIKEAEIEGIEQ
jgi:hypothetical protein